MTENQKRENLDWVTARSLCSLATVFETLKLQVQQDVETRNKLRPENAHYKFNFVTKGDRFTVFLEANLPHWSVQFKLSDKSIQIHDEGDNLLMEATVTLNDDGECRLRINGTERELWQVRKTVLERLFFSV